MAHSALMSTDSAAKSLLAGTDTINATIGVPIIRIMVLSICDALLNEVTEFLQEVQLHTIGALIAAPHGALLIIQVILRLRVLLHAHYGPTARKVGRGPRRYVFDLQPQFAARRWLLRYTLRSSLGYLLILIESLVVLFP